MYNSYKEDLKDCKYSYKISIFIEMHIFSPKINRMSSF